MKTRPNSRYYLSNQTSSAGASAGSAGSIGSTGTSAKNTFKFPASSMDKVLNPIVNVLNADRQPPQSLTKADATAVVQQSMYGQAQAEFEAQEKAKLQAQNDKMKQYGKYALFGLGGIAAIIIIKKII